MSNQRRSVSRRDFLETVGIAGVALAGCSDEAKSETKISTRPTKSPATSDRPTSTSTLTETDEPTETEKADTEEEPDLFDVSPRFSDRKIATLKDESNSEEEIVLEFENELRQHYEQFDQIVDRNNSWQTWLDSISDDSSFKDLKKLDIGAIYPMRTDREEYDRFLFDEFESAEPTLEALDWIHTYGMAWATEKERHTEDGFSSPFKDLNFRLAPVIEKSVNEYTENHCHLFPVDIHDEGDGNYVANIGRDGDNLYKMMMGFDLETQQLFLMESNYLNDEVGSVQELFMNYRTDRPRYDDGNWAQHTYDSGRLIHQTIQNSVYLPEIGKEGFEETVEENFDDEFDLSSKPPATDYWHPLRFDGSEPDMDELGFRKASVLTTEMLRNMATHPKTSKSNKKLGENAGIAPTKEYRASIPDAMLAMSNVQTDDIDGEIGYSSVFAQASILDELVEREEDYVIHGSMFEPEYGRVRDSQIIDKVWEDQEGKYDQIEEALN